MLKTRMYIFYFFFQDIVPWRKSRSILYWRLKRLLLQDKVISTLLDAKPDLGIGQGEAMLRRWFIEDKGPAEGYKWDNNETVVAWLEDQLNKPESIIAYNLHCVKKDALINQIKNSLEVRAYSLERTRNQLYRHVLLVAYTFINCTKSLYYHLIRMYNIMWYYCMLKKS